MLLLLCFLLDRTRIFFLFYVIRFYWGIECLRCYRYNKPLQASVRAVTNGTLWALKREDFRGILMSEFSNLSSLKLLRSVDLLSRLTILQLSHIAESLTEVSFTDGQSIVAKVEPLCILRHVILFTRTLSSYQKKNHICRTKPYPHYTLSRRD